MGDEVLVNIVGKMENLDDNKCWDGPYVIAELSAGGVYKLFKNGMTLTAKLNNNRLRKFKRPGNVLEKLRRRPLTVRCINNR